jgi:hypothetical protein
MKFLQETQSMQARNESRVQGILNENRSWKTKYKDLALALESANPRVRARAMRTFQVMQNQATYIEGLRSDPRMESTFTQNLGALVPKVIDLVRIFYPNMVAHDLVDIQPLDRQNGEIFVVKPTYDNTAAGVTAGQQVFKNVTDGTYASESSVVALTLTSTTWGGTLPTLTIRPGTATVIIRNAAGAIQGSFTDNGSGAFAAQAANTSSTVVAWTGTINYTSGVVAVTPGTAITGGWTVTVSARYDSESATGNIRKVSFNLGTVPVQAESHPLLVDWSVQAQLAASAHLNLDVPQTLADLVAGVIKQERDVTLINQILSAATADTNLNFDASAPTNYSRIARYAEIELKLNYAESKIQRAEGRGGVSWILCGTNAADIWRHCDGFEPSDVVAPIGPHKIGTLRDGTVAIIKNPFMNVNTYVIGFKGYVLGDAATILAEWIPLYATPVFQAPELINRQGMTSLYALFNQAQASSYYQSGTISSYAA